jgi:hypothetical protein
MRLDLNALPKIAVQPGMEITDIAKANETKVPFNNPSIRAAPHGVIFAARLKTGRDPDEKKLPALGMKHSFG